MKVTLESTSKVTELIIDGVAVPARVWQGRTERGIECVALVTRILCSTSADSAEFDAELQRHAPANQQALEAIPLRFIL